MIVGSLPIIIRTQRYKTAFFLLLLTAAATAVHGYHPYAEDAEIYLPGIEKILHPQLFPTGQEFFESHAHLTFFPNLIAFSLRVTHVPMEVGLLLWQLAAIFLLLLACWQLSGILFTNARSRWCGVCLVAGLLTIPVAGTALYVMDQYLNPRNLAAFAGVFAVTKIVEKKYWQAGAWLAIAACVHPLMWVFPFSWCALWLVLRKLEVPWPNAKSFSTTGVVAMLPVIPLTQPLPQAYYEAARLHTYFFLQRWEWYEWLGVAAPMGLLWWFGRVLRARQGKTAEQMANTFVIYTAIYVVVALAIDIPSRFESLARLQPMRSLHLLYIVLFLFIGGMLGEYVLKGRVWLWLMLFVPLCLGMCFAQRALFPASAHVEWPGAMPKNPWAKAFMWARDHTPQDAAFALDPDYLRIEGEDSVGFRCLAQRSRMADSVKDNGVVSMFPPLADEWLAQVRALKDWKTFSADDFEKLKQRYGVNWVIVQQSQSVQLDCPYQNNAVRVCQLH